MDQPFFEMQDVQLWQGAPWLSLRTSLRGKLTSPDDDVVISTYAGVATLAVPVAQRADAEGLGWEELKVRADRAVIDRDGYHAADTYRAMDAPHPLGLRLVIAQLLEEQHQHVWHLHPDLVVALQLLQEGDRWYRPEEGWAEVVRLIRHDDGEPARMEIRSEFLSDYLAASGASLFMSSYHERRAEPAALPAFTWPAGGETIEVGRDRIERRIENRRGRNRVSGALWRTEWFEPRPFSPRIRGDRDPVPTTFALDNQGGRYTPDQLQNAQDWLYFRPELVMALSRHRGFELRWISEQTGGLGATGNVQQFGVNPLGLINIFAKDIARFDPWEQRIWSAHNVPPEGGVSAELFAGQMQIQPAQTIAPETRVEAALGLIDERLTGLLEAPLLRAHDATPELLRRIHRFRAAEHDGLLRLANDLARIFAERIEVGPIHRHLALPAKEKLGSLKSLERLVATRMDALVAGRLMAPLFGIQDLRGAAAHLGGQLVAGAMANVGADPDAPAPEQGRAIISSFVDTLDAISELFAP